MAGSFQTIHKPTRARALDTSGNNNHGQIYSGRALEFDGVTDYLNTGYGSGLNPTTAPITISVWATYGTAGRMITGAIQNNGNRLYLGVQNDLLDLGIQASAWASGTATGTQPTLEKSAWYRIVVVLDAGGATLYLNGESQFTKTYTSYALTANFIVGNYSNSTSYMWDGMISDYQIWDAAFTADDVTYDYLNPEQLALNRGGTSLTESNLKLWYPMQDGHRVQQSFILDGANTGLGDDTTTNGSFDSESGTVSSSSDITGWTVSIGANNSMSLANGQLTLTQGAGSNNNFI